MTRNVLLYKSKWGATRQYAEWIKEEEPSLVLKELNKVDCSELDDYYKIVIGSRTYMGKIEAMDFLTQHWDKLKNKKVYLFSVGLIPPDSPESQVSYEQIPQEIRDGLAGYCKLMGRLDPTELNPMQKMIVKFRKIDELEQMDRKMIEPVVSFLKGVEWKLDHGVRYVEGGGF